MSVVAQSPFPIFPAGGQVLQGRDPGVFKEVAATRFRVAVFNALDS